jgi:hypothetical protein
MSNVSTRHPLRLFTAGDKPFPEQRLAKIGYKTSKKTPAKFPNVAVSIPPVDSDALRIYSEELLPFVRTLVEGAQDGIIRSLYESANGELIEVSDEDISIPACIGFLQAEALGDRLTKAAIETWFDSELRDNLFASVAEKLKFVAADGSITADQSATVEKHVKIYRDVLSMLAGGKTILAEKQIKGCKNALALAPDDSDSMVQRLTARLTAMETPRTIEEMLEL